ncbi:MAG: hypothetical protein ACR2NZ_24975 [Rubripirellula sp.]
MDLGTIVETLQRGKLDLLRVIWCDNGNVIRMKSLFLPTFLAKLDDIHTTDDLLDRIEHQVTISAALQSLPATFDAPAAAADLAPVQDVRLVPDWKTFSVAPTAPTIATVLGDMVLNGSPWAVCPRDFLRRALCRAGEMDVSIESGFEIEFYLLHPADDSEEIPTPVDRTVYASTVSADEQSAVILAILRALWRQGIPVAQYNPESGPGQQEITLQHCGPLELADRLVLARETIRMVANQHGLIATLIPEMFEEATGSGLHSHFSLWRDERNLLPNGDSPWNLSSIANSFMAGVLDHLPALMAATTPSINSYRRIRPHEWSGAYQAWGIANKEAAIRLINDPKNELPAHFELKTVDASANPYIALGNIINAGLDGIHREMQLPKPVEIDPGNYTDQQREQLHIATLPDRMDVAIGLFESDQVLCNGMGEQFAKAFTAVRRAEFDTMKDMTFDQERLTLLQRY